MIMNEKEMATIENVEKATILVAEMSCNTCVLKIQTLLGTLKGIENFSIKTGEVEVQYYSDIISKQQITKEIENLGYTIDERKNDERFIKRFLHRLIKNNKKNFGSSPLNCCGLNKR